MVNTLVITLSKYEIQRFYPKTRSFPTGTKIDYNAMIICHSNLPWKLIIYFLTPNTNKYGESVLSYSRIKSRTDGNAKIAYLFVPSEEFPYYVDLVRNEKPLYTIIYDGDAARNNTLQTGREPTGEEET